MHKYTLFLIISISIFSCNNKSEQKVPAKFVTISDKSFIVNHKPFFPLMLNYVVSLRKIEDSIVLSAPKYYENIDSYEANTLEENTEQLKAHLQLIKEMGFNTIRLIFLDRIKKDKNDFYFPLKDKIYIKNNSKIVIDALNEYIKIVEEFDLKLMILLEQPIENTVIKEFAIEILSQFKDNASVFAYDFFNEPLYFDNKHKKDRFREKESAYEIVNEWKEMMVKYAPNQLITIGFSEPIEVFEWDPSILPVDFLAFHTYHPLRVPNEIYWYSNYIEKPWMIGETALPSENDSIPYEHQQAFMKEVYQRIIDCGGAGLGWWEFQDMPDSHFEASYTGLLNHEGITKTKTGNYKIIGTVKPAVKEISNFKNYNKGECDCKTNYYNMIGYDNIVVTGEIVDSETKEPIEGAVIRGWDKRWSIGLNTFSNENGEFTIYSNDKCVHFKVSAPGMVRFSVNNKKIAYKPIYKHNYKIENLPNMKLEYQKIPYLPFLKNDSLNPNQKEPFIFNFKPEMFNNAKFSGSLGTIELEKADF